ncbi:MAG: two-component system sensor histidine kinase NtrB [Terriglobales bacterium]
MSAAPQFREQNDTFNAGFWRAALDACPESLAVVETGRILYADRAFGKAFGFPRTTELQGRLLADLLPQSTRFLNSQEIQFATPEGRIQIEASTSEFEADQRVFQVICIRPAPQANFVGGSSGEAQTRQSIRQLSAGIAHDLNNIMTGIMLYSDLLISGIEAGSRFRHHAEAIHKAGTNGVSLIQQLMIPSREEALAIQPLSWNQVVSEMMSLLTRLSGENIEIESKLAEPSGLVKIDSGSAERIILNLVLNARDAMPAGGKITLSTRNCTFCFANSANKTTRPIPCVEFSVADTGSGMDSKTLKQVFRPFFTTKSRNRGNGLWLTVVHDIIKQCGGEIAIESSVGKGTRVIIRMPRIEVS